MPKTTQKTQKKTRYAPYEPLRGVKVNSQLGNTAEDALLTDLVTRLGGTMVGVGHDVSYFVHDKGTGGIAVDDLDDALADFINENTSSYDELISREDMFEKLGEMMQTTCPLTEDGDMCATITLKDTDTVYFLRNRNGVKVGTAVPLLARGAHTVLFDGIILSYEPHKEDVWDGKEVTRIQLVENSANTFSGINFTESLFQLSNHATSRSCMECPDFSTIKDAMAWVDKKLQCATNVSRKDVREGLETRIADRVVEVVAVFDEFEDEQEDAGESGTGTTEVTE